VYTLSISNSTVWSAVLWNDKLLFCG